VYIEQFIQAAEASLSEIGKTEKVSSHLANDIAGCFSVLVCYPRNFSLLNETCPAIRKLLEPWCFWVAIKYLGNVFPTDIDPKLLSEVDKISSIFLKEKFFRVAARGNFHDSSFASLISYKEKWNQGQNSRSLYDLIMAKHKIIK
jgi:hypothetical protein